MPQWFAELRSRRLVSSIEDLDRWYREERGNCNAAEWQLSRFNRLWRQVKGSVPYWSRRDLPDQFRSWQEFADRVRPMDRALIQDQSGELLRGDLPICSYRSTGGSTGQPLQFPVCREELEVARRNLWYGRHRFGIDPSDRLFLIWGHSHALGSGFRGELARRWRRAADSFLGYRRWSAYDLSREALRQAGAALLEFRPNYVLGYSVAMDRFAEANQDRSASFRQLSLKGAIATAESFPRPDSAGRLEKVLGCHVIMEYGAVETGPIAYGASDGAYKVFWRDFFLEALPIKGMENRYELLVTPLCHRALPLLRYRIGDLVDTQLGPPAFEREIGTVVGRCNDFVELADGTLIHSEAFAHALKTTKAIQNFQVLQESAGRLRIDYLSERELSAADLGTIASRLARVHPDLTRIILRRNESLEQSIAGKTRVVMRTRDEGEL